MVDKGKMAISPKEYRKRVQLTDDFFFNRVMQDKELCRELAERLLGIKVESVEFHETQRVLRRENQSHGIQLDVMQEDSRQVIVFEAQMTNKTASSGERGFIRVCLIRRHCPRAKATEA